MWVAQLNDEGLCVALGWMPAKPPGDRFVEVQAYDDQLLGRVHNGQGWQAPPAPAASPTAWLIDVGPFMDRFGAAKLAVLASSNATVRALVTDLLARKWVDLQRPDLAIGIDLIIAAGVPGVDAALKSAILTAPVQHAEQLALRRLYF